MSESKHRNTRLDKILFALALALFALVFSWHQINQTKPQPTIATPSTKRSTAEVPPLKWRSNVNENSRYSLDELNYFEEIAFGSEHINITRVIRKWTDDVNIRVEGNPTEDDMLALKGAIHDINGLQDSIRLSIGWFETNLIVKYLPEATFHEKHPKYQGTNIGFFWVSWIDEVIYRATVLIDSDSPQIIRDSLIREELTQALGLMNDSDRFEDSIFNDDTNEYVPRLANIDKTLLTMLYRSDIMPAMSDEQALQILSRENRSDDPLVPN